MDINDVKISLKMKNKGCWSKEKNTAKREKAINYN